MGMTRIDWIIMAVYFTFVLGIGVALKRYMKTSTDSFLRRAFRLVNKQQRAR